MSNDKQPAASLSSGYKHLQAGLTSAERQAAMDEASARCQALYDGGAKLFTDNCSSCHTLADAGAKGQVGPNLDQLRPGPDLVTRQVNSGGGAMPSFKGKLTDAQIKQIADYVSKVAGKS